jgi:hypothetical protein
MTMPFTSQRLLSLAIDYSEGEKKDKLNELKDLFDACELCNDKATAAAFGYLLAQQEKERKDEPPRNAYDRVCYAIEDYENSSEDVAYTADKIFTIIFEWLCTFPDLPMGRLATIFAETMPPTDA